MNIGIDISLVPGSRAGVGTYSYNLVKYLAQLDSPFKYTLFPFFYYIYHPDFKAVDIPLQHAEQFRYKYKNLPKQWIDYLWNDSRISRATLLGDIDLLHSTTFSTPTGYKGKWISTIYDVSFYTHPQYHQKANIEHCLGGTIDAVKYAEKIIAISEHTKRDLMEHFHCPEEKIVVTPLGYDRAYYYPVHDKEEIQRVVNKYGVSGQYIFALGTVEPRKNIDGLIMAYDMLPQEIKHQYQLVIGGGKGWLDGKIFDLLKERKLEGRVKFIGYVDENDLRYLYSGATCFVFPSHYEGFGLPLLQAMACGVPVITANNSSLLEVAGDAALLVDAGNIDTITDALLQLLMDPALVKDLRKKGLAQAESFSWDGCARKTLAVYNSIS